MKQSFLIIIILLLPFSLWSQEKTISTGGFVRGSIYLSTDDYRYNINSVAGDASFNLSATDNLHFKGFADFRFRTGQQFGETVNYPDLHEAWAMYYNDKISLSFGKKIIKWGKTDFFTPLSKFNPVNYLYRTPDKEDTDMGNLLAEITLTPLPGFSLSFVTAPLWNPSVLMTSPLELPPYIKINLPEGLQAGNKGFSYGLKGDLTLKRTDISLQWYHGPDPMPGLQLTTAMLTDPNNIYLEMTGIPYNINIAGADFESALSAVVIRGSVSYLKPVREKAGNEEVPFPQVEWVAGIDWTPGSFRLTAEYSGKKVIDFYNPAVESLIGKEIDFAELAQQMMLSGLDPAEFARLQTEGFNRLYNYQLKENYHSAGLKAEYEMFYGKLTPSVTTMYNFTTKDLVLLPQLKFKPADAITFCAGMEYYSGPDKSLYDLVEEFMSAAFFSVRLDF